MKLSDGLGSMRSVVDNGLGVLQMRHYAPYGEVWGEQGTTQTPFGFTGEPTDANDLMHLRARYYSPVLGVFPSLDPLEGSPMQPLGINRYAYVQGNPLSDVVGELMGLNRYSYANNNPVNLTDPSGMIAERPEAWGGCRQTGDLCQECIDSYLDLVPNPDTIVFWGPHYYAAQQYCQSIDRCPPSAPPITSSFHLPMDEATLTSAGCLERRVESTFVPCSRDVNPRGQSGTNYPVYAPSTNGIVWYAGVGGSGLGNVVILKYDVNNLPSDIQGLLPASNGNGASLFIQYAHLSSSSVVSGNGIPNEFTVGYSGDTGGDYDPHLDVSVIWIPNQAAIRALGNSNFLVASNALQWDTLTTNGGAYSARWTIDPLTLWPSMRLDTPNGEPTGCQPSSDCKAYNS